MTNAVTASRRALVSTGSSDRTFIGGISGGTTQAEAAVYPWPAIKSNMAALKHRGGEGRRPSSLNAKNARIAKAQRKTLGWSLRPLRLCVEKVIDVAVDYGPPICR